MMEIVERSSGYWIVWSNESGVVDHPIFDQQPYVELDEAVAALETYEAEVKWTTKRFWSATKVKPKSMQTPPLNLASTTTFIINFFIVMTGIELFILIGGGYALYTVGMAIATNIDYYSTNKEEQLIKRRK